MDLHDALAFIDEHQEGPTHSGSMSPLQAIKQLNESVTEALLACIKDQPDQAGQFLQTALPELLTAMATLGVTPGQAQAPSAPNTNAERLIHIEGNRVEVWVDNEVRGSWSIWSVADLKEVCKLAEEFDCGLVYSFIGNLSPSRVYKHSAPVPMSPLDAAQIDAAQIDLDQVDSAQAPDILDTPDASSTEDPNQPATASNSTHAQDMSSSTDCVQGNLNREDPPPVQDHQDLRSS